MKELAKLAGVSPAAVSRYLNGGSLSAEKQAVIRAVIEKTGYQPDAAAQMLRTRTTDIVGIIVPKLDSESVSHVFAGAAEVLAQEGYTCQFAVSQNDPERELALLTMLQNRPAAGVILMATVCTARHEAALRALNVPAVVVGQRYRSVSCIYHDDYGAMLELTRLALKKGRRRPAYIGATETDPAAGLARRKGFQAGLTEFGLDAQSSPIEISAFDAEGGAAAMERLLARQPDLDAVLCATDRMAIGAMRVLTLAGRTVGQDVSVAGMGDSWAGRYTTPNLTTAHLYYKTCGESAAQRLVAAMKEQGRVRPIYQTMLGYEIQLRGSV